MRGALYLGQQTAIFAVAQMRAVHTWRSWGFGWLLRLLIQVSFFTLFGGFAADVDTMRYVLVGNAVILVCLESMISVTAVVDERAAGTLPLLAIAPTSHVPVYLGRGLHWLASGMVSSLVAWGVLPLVLGVPLPWPQALVAVPVILLVGVTSYCYGCFLSALAMRRPGLEWIILNLGYLPIMAFCGVNVPISFWPAGIRLGTEFFPVTHGLSAIRAILAGEPAAAAIGLELLVGAGWLGVAVVAINRVVAKGRTDGSLEFGN